MYYSENKFINKHTQRSRLFFCHFSFSALLAFSYPFFLPWLSGAGIFPTRNHHRVLVPASIHQRYSRKFRSKRSSKVFREISPLPGRRRHTSIALLDQRSVKGPLWTVYGIMTTSYTVWPICLCLGRGSPSEGNLTRVGEHAKKGTSSRPHSGCTRVGKTNSSDLEMSIYIINKSWKSMFKDGCRIQLIHAEMQDQPYKRFCDFLVFHFDPNPKRMNCSPGYTACARSDKNI